MRFIALIASVLVIVVLAAGCSAPSGSEGTSAATNATPTPGQGVALAVGSARIATVGGTATVPITLGAAPGGLSGFSITAVVVDPSIAEITAVAYPDWALLNSTTPSLPASQVQLRGVDLGQRVPVPAANLTLATLTVRAKASGSSSIRVTPDPSLGVQDRNGGKYTVAATSGNLVVGTP